MAAKAKNPPRSVVPAVEMTPLAIEPPPLKGGAEAEVEYRRIARELLKLGHLSAINRQSLVNYVEAWAIAGDALQLVNDEGPVLENITTGGKYQHPALNAWSMARKAMDEEAKALGMTPASLQAIRAAKPPANGSKKESGPRPSKFLT